MGRGITEAGLEGKGAGGAGGWAPAQRCDEPDEGGLRQIFQSLADTRPAHREGTVTMTRRFIILFPLLIAVFPVATSAMTSQPAGGKGSAFERSTPQVERLLKICKRARRNCQFKCAPSDTTCYRNCLKLMGC